MIKVSRPVLLDDLGPIGMEFDPVRTGLFRNRLWLFEPSKREDIEEEYDAKELTEAGDRTTMMLLPTESSLLLEDEEPKEMTLSRVHVHSVAPGSQYHCLPAARTRSPRGLGRRCCLTSAVR